MSGHSKITWSREAHTNLEKRVNETAKKPMSYANKKKILAGMTEDFVRY